MRKPTADSIQNLVGKYEINFPPIAEGEQWIAYLKKAVKVLKQLQYQVSAPEDLAFELEEELGIENDLELKIRGMDFITGFSLEGRLDEDISYLESWVPID